MRPQSNGRSSPSGAAGKRTVYPTTRKCENEPFSTSRDVPMPHDWRRSWSRRAVAERLRVLVAGWLNSPHVAAWAELVGNAGHDVHVVGRVAPGWPELELAVPSHRLSATWPPPLRGLHMSRALGRIAHELDPDLVHAHYLPEYGWMAARENLRPLISSAWGSDVLAVRGGNR